MPQDPSLQRVCLGKLLLALWVYGMPSGRNLSKTVGEVVQENWELDAVGRNWACVIKLVCFDLAHCEVA